MGTGSASVTIGICAYNESKNIERAVRSIYAQNVGFDIKVIVVSSGSTDGTDDIVDHLTGEYPSLSLLSQEKREGKNSAINLILDNASDDVTVLFNADNVFRDENCLANLISPFSDEGVGMVGGHPLPTNDKDTLVGFASNMIWTMHHYVSLESPKIGELIAFRNIGLRLPTDKQSDEELIRIGLEKEGYRSVYAPDAVVFNRGPETISDLVKQRTRVNIGQIYMRRDCDYVTPTWNKTVLFRAFLNTVKEMGFHPVKMFISSFFEFESRSTAKMHVAKDLGDKAIWEMVESTKKL